MTAGLWLGDQTLRVGRVFSRFTPERFRSMKMFDISIIARGTPGFTGADLANLVNEAALNAARFDKKVVTMSDFEVSKDKVMMGAERKSMVLSDEEKKLTAYHEAGHTLVGLKVPQADPVHKVSIIPRGMALGVTMQLPEADKHSHTKEYLTSQIAILMGGRIAEEVYFWRCQCNHRGVKRYRTRYRTCSGYGL